MYQIFVVEDELLIRQNIRRVIENMQGPYAFCGEASDGEIALSMMQDLMPDILLTDIRMPFLDGFGLIKHAKVMMPWLKIVIISGYGDFEFARKAISLGVDQYLLKPVRQADLVRVIEETAAKIEESRSARGFLPDGINENEVQNALQQQFIRQLLYGEADTGELLEKARSLKLDIIRSCYLPAVFSFDSPCPDLQELNDRLRKTLSELEMTMYHLQSSSQMTLLTYDNDPEALNERMYRSINILRHELKDVCPVITTVIGNEVRRLGAVSSSYHAAAGLLTILSGIAAGQVINVSDTAQVTADIIQTDSPFGKEFMIKLQHASPADVPRIIDGILASPEGNQYNSRLMRYYALLSLMKVCIRMTAGKRDGTEEKDIAAKFSAQFDILPAAESRERFRDTAVALLQYTLKDRQGNASEMKYSHVITRAEKYVRENYCDPNISLISVAKHVGMSSAHFSTVFSQTTGRSFISYLTSLRIGKAKELLTGTDMRLSDIALEIGYNEPNYFSHVFRKTEGMTPKEYRSRHSVQ